MGLPSAGVDRHDSNTHACGIPVKFVRTTMKNVRIAMLGSGFVADFYMQGLANVNGQEVAANYSRDRGRAQAFSEKWSTAEYTTDLEALIATTSNWQKTKVQPETMRKIVVAYGEVRANLLKHVAGWPEAATLTAVSASISTPVWAVILAAAEIRIRSPLAGISKFTSQWLMGSG